MHQLELKVPPPVVLAGFAACVVVLGYFVPSANLPFPGHRVLAVALGLFGMFIAFAGVAQFRRARTAINPMAPSRASSIVATGLFAWSRNPMYLGMAAALLGLSAWFATLAGYLLVALFCLYMTRFQIQPEERALLSKFGAEYEAYRARVRRWL